MAEAPVWSTACGDWERRILAGESLIPFPPLFPATADQAMETFRQLRIVDVPGQPTIGEVCRPWVMDFASAVFGAYDEETGRQLINQAFLLVAKKNWKSGLAAAIMLTALILNWRDSAEFLIIAPSVEVAGNSFGPAADMVNADPELRRLLRVEPFRKTIRHKTTGATLKVVAADNDSVSGKKATGVLVEEVWQFGKKPNAEGMLIEATGGLAARPEGFVIWISTMSDEQPAGVFKQKLDYFRGVRDGAIDDRRSLPVLYEWPPSLLKAEAYRGEALWRVTNPNLGASVDVSFLRQKATEAEQGGPSAERGFWAKHLNVEFDVALRSGAWAGAEFWSSSADKLLTLESLLQRSDVVTIGGDGGGRDDLLGLCLLGRERGTGRWLSWCRAYAWPTALQQRKAEAARYDDFRRDGDLVIADDVGDDLSGLVALVERVRDAGLLPAQHAIGVDPGNHHAITQALTAAGFPADQIAFVSQGWKLGGAMKLAERKLADGTLIHADQRLMAWSVGNAKVEPKGNAVIVTKQASGSAKVDPLMALLNAVELMSRNPVTGTRSIYSNPEAWREKPREMAAESIFDQWSDEED